ncbi:hypothetical protein N499_1381 [Wolbachia pipientis wVitA]|nr:hypothetical protein N499_1381 [Wolbachia pipientis wVitA]
MFLKFNLTININIIIHNDNNDNIYLNKSIPIQEYKFIQFSLKLIE